MKPTGAAILVSHGSKVLQAAQAAFPYRSAAEGFVVDAVGRVAKQIGSRGFYATVSVQFSLGGERRVSLAPAAEDAWYRSQGWLTAATDGVSFGLNLAKVCGECVVTRVHGMPCDTSAGLVALASIRAAWAAVSFIPGDAIAVAVESCILRGHRLSPEAVGAELTLAARKAEPSVSADVATTQMLPTIGLTTTGNGVDRSHYTIWFSSVDPRTLQSLGAGDFRWRVTVSARSEAEALKLGLADARDLSREFGLPPHGLRVSEEELLRFAYVQQMEYGLCLG